MLRDLSASACGYLLFAIAATSFFRFFPPPGDEYPPLAYQLAAVANGLAGALAGGYLSAWVAGRRSLVFGSITAALIAVFALLTVAARMSGEANWFEIWSFVLFVPAAWCGAWIRRWVKHRRSPSSKPRFPQTGVSRGSHPGR